MKKTALALTLIIAILFSASANYMLYPPTTLSASYLASASSSGGWMKTYGGADSDSAEAVVQTSDGGYALAGYTGSGAWLVKTDSFGSVEWTKTYGEAGGAQSIVQTIDGGYALAGTAGSSGWLAKTDSAGNMQWNRTYEGDYEVFYAFSGIQTSDGGYALAATARSLGADGYGLDFWLIKTNALGDMEWNKTYGEGEESVGSLVQTSDGGYALAGTTYVDANGGDFLFVKTDSTGDMEWSKTYGSQDKDDGRAIVQTSDGGYALAGLLWNRTAGGFTAGIVKTDSMGNTQWMRTYNVGTTNSIIQTSDGGYAIVGSPSEDAQLVKTDSEGKVQWIKVFEGTDEFTLQLNSIIQTSEGYVMAGKVFWPVTIDGVGRVSSDALLIKTDSDAPSPTNSPTPTSSPDLTPTPSTSPQSETPTSSPAATPTPTPYQEPQQTEQETIIGAAIAAVVIGAGLGLLIYLIKRK